jgi:hypothetical protein
MAILQLYITLEFSTFISATYYLPVYEPRPLAPFLL